MAAFPMSACVGLGTMRLKETCEAAVAAAAELCVGLVDTAEHYGNLERVGAGLQKAGKRPFLVCKLSGLPCGEYAAVRARMNAQLKKLNVDKADCCLIHWPGLCDWDVTDDGPLEDFASFKSKCTPWDVFVEKLPEAWDNMTKLQNEGLTAHIGVSNFYAHHLEVLAERCGGAKPFINEIYIDCMNQETEFVANMQSQGIHVLAYRPLGYLRNNNIPDAVVRVASRRGCTPQVLVLAWLTGRGIYPLVKCRGAHVEENLAAPGAVAGALTSEDLQDIASCANASAALVQEFFAAIWAKHRGGFSEGDVKQLMEFGIEEAKARECLAKANGNLEEAMNLAFSEQ